MLKAGWRLRASGSRVAHDVKKFDLQNPSIETLHALWVGSFGCGAPRGEIQKETPTPESKFRIFTVHGKNQYYRRYIYLYMYVYIYIYKNIHTNLWDNSAAADGMSSSSFRKTASWNQSNWLQFCRAFFNPGSKFLQIPSNTAQHTTTARSTSAAS